MKARKLYIGSVLLVVVVVAGLMAGVAFAGNNQPQNAAENTICQDFVAKLAANLGLTTDQVSTALNTTKQQMLDDAVQQGKITQEQADKMASKQGFFGGFCHGKNNDFRGHKGRNLDLTAQALGMTVDELKAELQSGKKLSDIVTDKGMSMEQLKEKIKELKPATNHQAPTTDNSSSEQ